LSKAFLQNAWYVAAWADEICDGMESRTIIGRSILLYRDQDSSLHAMDNTCPHRYAPLHMGKLVDGNVVCPYHALAFNAKGNCVHNPNGNNMIPGKSDLRVYPVIEKHAMIWIWIGDVEHADESTIPDFSCHSNPSMKMVKGTLEVNANYELITDNLMDLTHVVTVHEDCLGSEAVARAENTVLCEGTTVWSNSWAPDGLAPPAWDAMFGNYGKPVDHWLYMRWDAPAHMLLDVGITPTGKLRGEGVWVYGTDILTPIDEETTLYFWAITRTQFIDDPKYDEMWTQAIKHAFVGQDKPMLEAQQQMLKLQGHLDIDDVKHATINTDAGPVRARFVLKQLLKADGNGPIAEPRHQDLSSLIANSREANEVQPVV
jgi:phenylpropionate dioxygenase-like ring-hydroxylating dioxygenase large terminal subunit